jgi:hypothetical protein
MAKKNKMKTASKYHFGVVWFLVIFAVPKNGSHSSVG